MIAPKEIREKWEEEKERGDVASINKESKISIATINKCMNGSDTSEKVFDAISKFYIERKMSRAKKFEKALK